MKYKLEMHPVFFLFMIFSVVTGYMKDFAMIMLLIVIHECGHIIVARKYHWNISKIKILPLGSITLFEEDINRPLKEELHILIGGPLSQFIGFLLLSNWISDPLFSYYHWMLLLFNLMPIVPLDGSKFVNIIMNYYFSFLTSYVATNCISLCTIIFLILFSFFSPFNFMGYLVLLSLSFEIYRSIKRTPFLFHRFLWERYNKTYIFPKHKYLFYPEVTKMKRDTYHVFQGKDKCYSEREILAKRFDFSHIL